jgi:DNA-binding response OmpR family regulator
MKVICKVSFLPGESVISSGILRQNEYTVHDVHEDTSPAEIMQYNPDVLLFDPCAPLEKVIALRRAISANPLLKDIPIIAVTTEEISIISDIGRLIAADVYLTAPVNRDELLRLIQFAARVRRTGQENSLRSGKISIDTMAMSVSVNGNIVALRPKEFELLKILVSRPGCVFTREQLCYATGVKRPGKDVRKYGRSIDTHIKIIRKVLGKYGKCIHTVFGKGFRYDEQELLFKEPVTEDIVKTQLDGECVG